MSIISCVSTIIGSDSVIDVLIRELLTANGDRPDSAASSGGGSGEQQPAATSSVSVPSHCESAPREGLIVKSPGTASGGSSAIIYCDSEY